MRIIAVAHQRRKVAFSNLSKKTTAPTSSEVTSYLQEELQDEASDPLLYWSSAESRYSKLAKQAQKYLAIPASSAPVERIFSVAGKILRPDRARMTDKTFETLMFCKCNKVFS